MNVAKTTVPGFANDADERRYRAQYLAKLSSHVAKRIGRSIKDNEQRAMKRYIDTLDVQSLHNSGSEIVGKFAHALTKPLEPEPDTHEYMNSIIGLQSEDSTNDKWLHERLLREKRVDRDEQDGKSQSITTFLGLREPHDLAYVLNPGAQAAVSFVELDSRYRNLAESNGTEVISFSTRHGGGYTDAQGVAPHRGSIRDVSGFRFIRITLPTPATYQSYYGEMSILLREFNESAIPCRDNQWAYHMKFSTEVLDGGSRLALTPLFDGGRIDLPNIVPEISKLSFQFGSPYTPVIFDTDRLTATLTGGATTTVTTSANHNLTTNDIVFFNTDNPFTTDSAVADSGVIDQINTIHGLAITSTGATTFTVDVDSSGLVGTPQDCTCYLGSKRIMVTVQVLHQRPKHAEKP